MSQQDFWKQLIRHTKNWKVIQIGLNHIERQEKAAAVTATK